MEDASGGIVRSTFRIPLGRFSRRRRPPPRRRRHRYRYHHHRHNASARGMMMMIIRRRDQCASRSGVARTVIRSPSIVARATATSNRCAFARGRDPACAVGRAMLAAAAARSMTEAALPLHLLHVLRTFIPTNEPSFFSRRRSDAFSRRINSFLSFSFVSTFLSNLFISSCNEF